MATDRRQSYDTTILLRFLMDGKNQHETSPDRRRSIRSQSAIRCRGPARRAGDRVRAGSARERSGP
eukprot:2487578-Pyramimonas_sp.AAC.1